MLSSVTKKEVEKSGGPGRKRGEVGISCLNKWHDSRRVADSVPSDSGRRTYIRVTFQVPDCYIGFTSRGTGLSINTMELSAAKQKKYGHNKNRSTEQHGSSVVCRRSPEEQRAKARVSSKKFRCAPTFIGEYLAIIGWSTYMATISLFGGEGFIPDKTILLIMSLSLSSPVTHRSSSLFSLCFTWWNKYLAVGPCCVPLVLKPDRRVCASHFTLELVLHHQGTVLVATSIRFQEGRRDVEAEGSPREETSSSTYPATIQRTGRQRKGTGFYYYLEEELRHAKDVSIHKHGEGAPCHEVS